jgi:hypothetical protein
MRARYKPVQGTKPAVLQRGDHGKCLTPVWQCRSTIVRLPRTGRNRPKAVFRHMYHAAQCGMLYMDVRMPRSAWMRESGRLLRPASLAAVVASTPLAAVQFFPHQVLWLL